ncbi:doublecortin domain-containing protein 2C [Trichechus manatus latirostris]|uniref:Doublecortin domain-containing protein 2C n=1 Tax=Trichechus manatus latirostris TaxID=127582 RepID=A0A2Y9QX85_TRIMA|nr:doublecortin domain-containing protein 2C [Trichechus manatus latirostris]
MGTHGTYTLIDTTPAKTILVYRNGDQYYVGKKFVFNRRRVASFEAFLNQLNDEIEVPFGVRRLYTPTHGHQVQELDSVQQGGKYVAAGRERFKKLNYIHIVPRKPSKIRKLKEIKPVVHCEMNVPSRWQTFNRTSRHINVFTNGKLFIPPVKIIIPKFSLSDWNTVLALIGEKVFPLGGVRKLFTMNGRLLDNSKDLQDHHFYVAAGLEPFKYFPYWKSSKVPSEIQQRYTDTEKHPRRKKKVNSKGKEPHKPEDIPTKAQDSVYHAKERKKKTLVEPLITSGAEGDVYKARTPNAETQGAPEVKEDQDVKEEVPVDQLPAEIVKEDEEIHDSTDDFEGNKVMLKQGDDVIEFMFLKNHPDSRGKGKKEKKSHELLETPVKVEAQRKPPLEQQLQEQSSPRQQEQIPEKEESLGQSSPRLSSQEQIREKQESLEQSSLRQSSQEQIPKKQESIEPPSPRQSSQKQIPERQESLEQSLPEQQAQEEAPEKPESLEQSSPRQSSQEQIPEKQKSLEQLSLGQQAQEQVPEREESPEQPSPSQSRQEQIPEKQEFLEQSLPRQPSEEQISEKRESLEQLLPEQQAQEQVPEKQEPLEQSSPEQLSQEQMPQEQQTQEQLS